MYVWLQAISRGKMANIRNLARGILDITIRLVLYIGKSISVWRRRSGIYALTNVSGKVLIWLRFSLSDLGPELFKSVV